MEEHKHIAFLGTMQHTVQDSSRSASSSDLTDQGWFGTSNPGHPLV